MGEDAFDCAILGAGLAGSAAAWRLARLGRRVLLLEREALPRVKPCGGGVSPEIAAWFDFDFSPVISARVTRLRFTFRHGDPVEAPMGTQESLWMVRRDAFDRFLAGQAEAAGAELRGGCPALGLRFDGSAWIVETPAGPVMARFLIAADGAKGPAARWLGFGARKRRLAGALEAEFAVRPAGTDCAHLDFGSLENGYLWAFPKADGWSVGAGVFRGGSGRGLRRALESYAAAFGLDASSVPAVGHPLLLWDGDQRLHTRNALLAGEAACLVDPFTAEGIRPALRSGLLAAEAVHETLAGSAAALEGYSLAVQRELGREMAWARRLARAFHRMPAMAYRVGVKHPGAPHHMGRLLCGEIRYSEVAHRALRRLGLGLLGGA